MIVFAHTKFGLVWIQGSEVKRGAESAPRSERVFQIPVQIGLNIYSGIIIHLIMKIWLSINKLSFMPSLALWSQ